MATKIRCNQLAAHNGAVFYLHSDTCSRPPQPARAGGPYRNHVHSTQLRAVCLYYRRLVATRIPRCQTARRAGVNTADGAKLHGGGDAGMLHQSDIRECGARAWRPIPVVRRDCPCAGCQLQNPAFCACGIAGKCLYFMHGTDRQ